MKKKFMMVAAIFGILSLGSCVDDNESPSVEELRRAKAKQLEAMGEMYKAYGEADLVRAQAEAALNEAKAEYQKWQTEEAKEKFALEIQKLQAELERDLLAIEKEIADNEKALLGIEDEKLNELYRIYSDGAAVLKKLNDDLLAEKITLMKAEAQLISAKALLNQKINAQETIMARETAKRDALKALPANNNAALAKEIEEYKAALIPIKADKAVKTDAKNKATKAYDDSKKDYEIDPTIDSSIKIVKAAKEIENDYRTGIVKEESIDLTDTETVKHYTLITSEVTREKNQIKSDIETKKAAIGVATSGSETGMYATLKTLTDTRNTAQTDYNTATASGSGYTDAQKEALRNALQLAIANVQEQNEKIADENKKVGELQAKLSTFEALVEIFATELSNYNTAIESLKALAVAKEAAEVALKVVTDKETDTNYLLTAVEGVYNGTEDLPKLIAAAEVLIANAEKTLASLSDIDDENKLIAFSKEEIEILTAKIAAQKVIVAKAKAALEAATKA